jgi:predicted ATPase
MIAALIGPEPAKFYFFEEIENGIHPTRLHLLMQLIESKTIHGNIQVVASSHSPQLLAILGPSSLRYTSLVFRLENDTEARIKGILDIPNAKEVIGKQDIAKLLSTGWLEDAVAFTSDGGMAS